MRNIYINYEILKKVYIINICTYIKYNKVKSYFVNTNNKNNTQVSFNQCEIVDFI